MKLVKAIGTPQSLRYDSTTVVEVPLGGIVVSDPVAAVLAERCDVSVSDVPAEVDLGIPILEPISDSSVEPVPVTVPEPAADPVAEPVVAEQKAPRAKGSKSKVSAGSIPVEVATEPQPPVEDAEATKE